MKHCNRTNCFEEALVFSKFCPEHLMHDKDFAEKYMNDPTHPLFNATVVGPKPPKLVKLEGQVCEAKDTGATYHVSRFDSPVVRVFAKNTTALYEPTREEKVEYVNARYRYEEFTKKHVPDPTANKVGMDTFDRQLVEVLKELEDLLRKKNADYGSSYDKSVEEFGSVVTLIRLGDKFNRLKQLITSNEPAKVEETIEETLLDLVGYGIIELVRRRRK